MNVAHLDLVLAQAGGGGQYGFVMIIAMFAIFYFILIRPQQKQLKEHRALLGSLKKGDEIVTQGGMFGRIHALTEKVVTLEIANGVRVQVLKSSVQSRASAAQLEASSTTTADKDKPEKKEGK